MRKSHSGKRTGSVYLVVLGTAMIVSTLALSALTLQRIQNRQLSVATDIRQAELNAEAAIELGMLAIESDEDWRTNHSHGVWFSNRSSGAGTCMLFVGDTKDGDLADDPDDPVYIWSVGISGDARQYRIMSIYPKRSLLSSLEAAVVVGDQVDLLNDTLRASGLISAGGISASSSSIYGDVEASSISGGTYYGTTTTVDADDRPTMPDWATVFDYYRTNGTEISISNLPSTPPNMANNAGIESDEDYWTGEPPGVDKAKVEQKDEEAHSGDYSLKVNDLNGWSAGAAQYIDSFVEPGKQYTVEVWVFNDDSTSGFAWLTLYTKGSGAASYNASSLFTVLPNKWTKLSATLTAPSWSGDLQYAFVKVGSYLPALMDKFYVDDFVIREATSGRFIYREALGPGYNPFGTGETNSEGVYWIDCQSNDLVIKRSRIRGTLLVVNPGSNSRVEGPVHWSPAMPGYPALLVDADNAAQADFTISTSRRVLSEAENGVNFNPVGVADTTLGEDAVLDDTYPSEIQGLVAIEDDLSYANEPLIRGQLIIGDDIKTSSGSLEVEFGQDSLLSPPPGFEGSYEYIRRPGAEKKLIVN